MIDDALPIVRLLRSRARPGRVDWIGLRPERLAPVRPVDEASLDPESGLAGDHYRGRLGIRHLTVIQSEHIAAVASFLGMASIDPGVLRRNVVVSGFNLHALRTGDRFRIGSALLEKTGECHPCARMERVLGEGGYRAMRGHGGITARVLQPGLLRLGDGLERIDEVAQPSAT